MTADDLRTKRRLLSLPPSATLALWLLLILGSVGASSYYALLPQRMGSVELWLFAGLPTVLLAAIALSRAYFDGELKEWLKPAAGDISIGFVGAAILFGLSIVAAKTVFARGTARAIWLQSLYIQLGDIRMLKDHVWAVVPAILIISFAEEVLWRGLVTTLLAERFGSRHAWIVSAVLYALAYVPTMWALKRGEAPNPVLPIAALGCGLLWGAMARRFGRLTPAIFSHALYVFCATMMFPLFSLAGT